MYSKRIKSNGIKILDGCLRLDSFSLCLFVGLFLGGWLGGFLGAFLGNRRLKDVDLESAQQGFLGEDLQLALQVVFLLFQVLQERNHGRALGLDGLDIVGLGHDRDTGDFVARTRSRICVCLYHHWFVLSSPRCLLLLFRWEKVVLVHKQTKLFLWMPLQQLPRVQLRSFVMSRMVSYPSWDSRIVLAFNVVIEAVMVGARVLLFVAVRFIQERANYESRVSREW